jgi:hypothetical protein
MSDLAGAASSILSVLRTLPLWIFIGLALAGFGVLFVPPFVNVDPAPVLKEWGAWIWIGAVTFSTLSIAGLIDRGIAGYSAYRRARAERRVLRLVPLHEQRWWHLAKQQDDSYISQISFQCQVTNTTDRPVRIVRGRLIRPRARVSSAFVSLPLAGSPYHSSAHPVPPHDTVRASIHMMARRALTKQGRPIRITVGISDQFGEEYKLRNLQIETHDRPAPPRTFTERVRGAVDAIAIACRLKSTPAEPPSPAMPWTYHPGPEYLNTCEAILREERRSYAARGRREGKLGSLNVGLQSEPNFGWTKEGDIPQLLWSRDQAPPLGSPNLDRLLTLRNSLSTQDGDNLERFLLCQLRRDSPYADVGLLNLSCSTSHEQNYRRAKGSAAVLSG